MRSLTTNIQTKVAQNLGTEPIIVAKIDWTSGTVYYSDKTITIGAISAVGAIVNFDNIDASKSTDTSGEVSTVSLDLSDTDGSLKTIWNTDIIENTAITVYHYYVGNDQADMLKIFSGNIVNPVNWDESQRTLSLEAESVIDSAEAGYAPEDGDITDLDPDAIGVAWPMGFGTCIHVPCVKIKSRPDGSLRGGINHNYDEFVIDNGVDFPQDETIQILIGKYKYEGSFSGNTFTATSKNMARHTNLSVADRPINDPQYDDPKVLWLDSDDYIRGLYCIVNHAIHGWMVNICIAQDGRKCYFRKPWRPNNTYLGVILNASDTISETAPCPRSDWAVTYVIEATFWYYDNSWDPRDGYVIASIKVQDSYGIPAGEPVRLVTSYNDLYVANLFPSLEILDVYGYRKDGDKDLFVPIPSRYYTKSLSNTLDGNNATTIEMTIPLEDIEGENWQDDVYVSYRSTIGPNAASIIKYLIETYTNYTIDATSYTQVVSKVSAYWANFARFNKEDALQLCEQIAWQSRIALIARDDTLVMRYLSEVPSSNDLDLTAANIEDQTLQLSFKNTDDLATKITARYKIDYSGRPDSEKIVIYENNTDVYKTIEKEYDMFIYNVFEFVKLSTYWWGYRDSNSWRQASFATFLDSLGVEIFDIAALNTAVISDNEIRCTVLEVNQDSDDHSIALGLEMSSKAGDVDSSNEPQEDVYYFLGDPNYNVLTILDPDDPGSGRDEIDYDIPDYDENSGDDDSGDTDDGSDPSYQLQFDVIPEEVERTTNFTMTITARNYLGEIHNVTKSVTLAFASSDGSDSFNLTNITLVNGSYSTTTAQITGGSGSDSGSIVASTSGYTSATASFDIIDALSTLSWDTYPSSVTRESTFSVAISGGSAALTLTVTLNSSDPDDKLYDNSGEITSITLDGSGAFSAADWYIKGGTIDAHGSITLHDATRAYEDATCPQFDISGVSTLNVSHTMVMSQANTANAETSVITVPASIDAGVAFSLTATRKDSDGDTLTSFNGYFIIQIYDNNGALCTFIDAGPDAQNYTDYIVAKATSGVWTYSSCKINIPSPAASPATVYLKEYNETTWEDSDTVTIAHPYFVVAAPSLVERGTAFNLTVTAYNGDDTINTSYVPDTIVLLTWTTPDSSDSTTPLFINNSGWSSGAKTTSCLISGGTTEGAFTVVASDASNQQMSGEDSGNVGEEPPASCTDYSTSAGYGWNWSWTGGLKRSGSTALGSSPYNPSAIYDYSSGDDCHYYDAVGDPGGGNSLTNYHFDVKVIRSGGGDYWQLEIKYSSGSYAVVMVRAVKYFGSNPSGSYTVTYRNTGASDINTIDDLLCILTAP